MATGLLRQLDAREIEAVVAHELTHLANRDAAVLTFVPVPRSSSATSGRTTGLAAAAFVLLLPVRILSLLLTWTVSRYRELAADRGASLVTGAPEAPIGALLKLDGAAPRKADLRGGAAARAFWILPPSPPRFVLFPEHPPLGRRIRRLERLAAELRDG